MPRDKVFPEDTEHGAENVTGFVHMAPMEEGDLK